MDPQDMTISAEALCRSLGKANLDGRLQDFQQTGQLTIDGLAAAALQAKLCCKFSQFSGILREADERDRVKAKVELLEMREEKRASSGKRKSSPSLGVGAASRRPKVQKKCDACGTVESCFWRRGDNQQQLCNACKLYLGKHSSERPSHLIERQEAKIKQDAAAKANPALQAAKKPSKAKQQGKAQKVAPKPLVIERPENPKASSEQPRKFQFGLGGRRKAEMHSLATSSKPNSRATSLTEYGLEYQDSQAAYAAYQDYATPMSLQAHQQAFDQARSQGSNMAGPFNGPSFPRFMPTTGMLPGWSSLVSMVNQ